MTKDKNELLEIFYDELERDTDLLTFDIKYGRLYLDYIEDCLIFVDDLNEEYAYMSVIDKKVLYADEAKDKIKDYIDL